MKISVSADWYQENYRYLRAEVIQVSQVLEQHIKKEQPQSQEQLLPEIASSSRYVINDDGVQFRLDTLCDIFKLKPSERFVLLMCVGMEIIPNFKRLCNSIIGAPYPTFALAYKVCPNFDWGIISNLSPLQHFSLIQIGAGQNLTHSPLCIDQHILCYLLAEASEDEKLKTIVKPFIIDTASTKLLPSHQKIASRLAATWLEVTSMSEPNNIVQLCGIDSTANIKIAATACYCARFNLHTASSLVLPTKQDEIKVLLQRWEREALLSNSILLLDCHNINVSDKAALTVIQQLIENIGTKLIISSCDPLPLSQRSLTSFDVLKLTPNEQIGAWQDALSLNAIELNGDFDKLVSQFSFSQEAIYTVVSTASRIINTQELEPNEQNSPAEALWDACRKIARPQLDDLAQRIDTNATWDKLVLPDKQKLILQNIVIHVQKRHQVYREWGFAETSARGLGISALFSGESGLGKTFAAEVIANELRLDLYRIDLSSVISKYIGETEKNIRRIFDAAELSGAVLLFDEADALFGKRTQVKDSHDRNANMETNYLLQRIEAYTGLAILTTNLGEAIDSAFLRRIRFIVRFEFPLAQERIEIWKRIFPRQTPTEGLDYNKLARLNATGATIRNIAMNAAFIAAEAQEPVMMKHLLTATYAEYSKMGQSLGENQVKGWV